MRSMQHYLRNPKTTQKPNHRLRAYSYVLACTSVLHSGLAFAQALPASTYVDASGNITQDIGSAERSWLADKEFNGNWGLAAINAHWAYMRGYTGLNSVVGIIDDPVWLGHEKFLAPVNGKPKVNFITTAGKIITEDPYQTKIESNIARENDDRMYLTPVVYIKQPPGIPSHGNSSAAIAAGNRDSDFGVPGEMQGVAFRSTIVATTNIGRSGLQSGKNLNQAAFHSLMNHNVDIISNSWGYLQLGPVWRHPEAYDQFFTATEKTDFPIGFGFEGASSAARSGIIVEFSAGNEDGKDPHTLAGLASFIPELEPHWLATMSVQQDLSKSSFSSDCGFTKYFCVAAPGTGINTATIGADITGKVSDDLIENPISTYEELDGTSFSGPFASGALAVLKERYSYLSNADINSILKTTATDLGAPGVDDVYGWGLINLKKATDGPGQLLGAMDVSLSSATTDIWANDISQDGLNQRKQEEQSLLNEWPSKRLKIESEIVTLGEQPKHDEDAIARTETTLARLKTLFEAQQFVGFDDKRYTDALAAFESDPGAAAWDEFYSPYHPRWKKKYAAPGTFDELVEDLSISDLATIIQNPELIRAVRANGERVRLIAASEFRVKQLAGKTDADYIGSITKSGDGKLTLSGKNTYEGQTRVRGGQLVIDGSIIGQSLVDATGIGELVWDRSKAQNEVSKLGGHLIVNGKTSDITVEAGGRATLNGISGTVNAKAGSLIDGSGKLGELTANAGSIVAPGNSIGTLTASKDNGSGNVTLQAGSIYRVEIDESGRSDSIHAENRAAINGSIVTVAAIDPQRSLQTLVKAADQATNFKILTAAGGIDGQFASGTATQYALFKNQFTYQPNDVNLRINRLGFDALGKTANAQSAARGLESVGAADPTYQQILATPTGQDVSDRLQAMGGETISSANTNLLYDGLYLRDAVSNRLGKQTSSMQQATSHGYDMWLQGFGSWGRVNGDGNAVGYRRNASGFFGGIDGELNDHWRAGVLFGYSKSSINSALGKNDADNYHIGLYGGANFDAVGLKFGAAYTHHEIANSRSIPPKFTSYADYSADSIQLFGEASYKIEQDRFVIEPFANISYAYLATSSINETGALGYDLRGKSGDTNLYSGGIGARLFHDIDLGGQTVRLNASAQWRHTGGDISNETRFAFNGGQDFSSFGTSLAKNAIALKAGFDVNLTQNATLNVSYVGQIAKTGNDHGVKAMLQVKF